MPAYQNLWPGANPVTVRASAALPAAGAYDAAPTEFPTANIDNITLYATYTRGNAGGAVTLHIEQSPYSADVVGVQSWFRTACVACGTISSGSDTTQNAQRANVVYGATGAGAENFVIGPLELYGTVERMRVACAESGQTGTPGTCHIVAVMV